VYLNFLQYLAGPIVTYLFSADSWGTEYLANRKIFLIKDFDNKSNQLKVFCSLAEIFSSTKAYFLKLSCSYVIVLCWHPDSLDQITLTAFMNLLKKEGASC